MFWIWQILWVGTDNMCEYILNKTVVINNDPPGQPRCPVGIDYLPYILKTGDGRTDRWTDRIVITIYRDIGLA